tara:strand:+ start:742 stop:1164 length:423 start_codon:yes stop_codon:yes gene_type:complete
MKEESIKNFIKKYKSGTSSLEEEIFLFDSKKVTNSSIQMIFSFIKKNKKEVPQNFNDKMWMSFDKKTKKMNQFRIGLLSTAASIVLLLSIYISNKNELTNSEKEALLIEAKSMFIAKNQKEKNYTIIIQNELVVVYTKHK